MDIKHINVEQVPIERNRDETLLLSETNGCKGVSRVGPAFGFDPSRRITVDAETLRWEILPKALGMGKQMEEDTDNAGASGISTNRGRKLRRPVVRFSREGLASALRLTEQMLVCVSFQIAVHGAQHASFILFNAHGPKDRVACWESPGIR